MHRSARYTLMVGCLSLTTASISAVNPLPTDTYGDVAARLVGAALTSETILDRLEYLCDRIGNRLSGSPALEKAVAWSAEAMKGAGFQNVRTIPVKVPHWVRGQESLTMLTPVARPIAMLGLGGSVATPPGGIEADVVTVSSFEDLERLGRSAIAGRIVLFNAVYEGYGKTNTYRTNGAARAAKLGAVAALVRSITGFSMRSPHTGAMRYDEGAAKIPTAAVSVEDAAAIGRLSARGVPVKVKLMMEAHTEPDADSFDVMGEITGREKPDEVVVLGGHLDSWDVGQGAQDDGSGIMAAFEAVALVKKLNLHPRRTIRVVFWTNEENGGAGGRAYREWLGDKLKNHIAAIEMDGGAEKPVGFDFGPTPSPANPKPETSAAFQRVVEIGRLLRGIDAADIGAGGSGSDIQPLIGAGVPGFGLRTTSAHYFDWHHSQADTFDKVDPDHFRRNVAALAVMSYVLADMPEKLTDLR